MVPGQACKQKGGLLMTHRTMRFLLAVVCSIGLAFSAAGAASAWGGGHRQPNSLWALYYAQLR